MLSTLTLDDQIGSPVALINPPKREIETAQGLFGIGDLRDSKRVRPTSHGGINETRYSDGKTITLEGAIGSNVSVADVYNEWRTLSTVMIDTLDGNETLLKWSEPSGLSLQRLVKLDGLEDPKLSENAALINYQASFFAEDYRAYSQTLTTSTGNVLAAAAGGLVMPFTFPFTFSLSGGGTVTATNSGNRPTPPVWRIYGYCVNPSIVFLGDPSARRLVFNGTVPAGSYLELDMFNRTVRMNGSSDQNRANFFDAANSSWWELPVGTSNYQLVAADFDGVARLDVLGRAAYA